MIKKRMTALLAALVVSLAAVSLVWAATTVKDEIVLKTKEYPAHTYNAVPFTHKKHVEGYKLNCGQCHHDAKGKPLALKAGDNVQRCIECHNKPGKAEVKKGEPKLSNKDKRMYHAEAMHDNCISCHKDFNKAYMAKTKEKKGPAPTSCNACHPGGKLK